MKAPNNIIWFDRKFEFVLPVEMYPIVVESRAVVSALTHVVASHSLVRIEIAGLFRETRRASKPCISRMLTTLLNTGKAAFRCRAARVLEANRRFCSQLSL